MPAVRLLDEGWCAMIVIPIVNWVFNALYWLGVFVLIGAVTVGAVYNATRIVRAAIHWRPRGKRKTAPGPSHLASRTLAARRSWMDEQGDTFAVSAAAVGQVVPSIAPDRIEQIADDYAVCAALESEFGEQQRRWARALNADLADRSRRVQP